jgi:hypothetical protein
MHRIIASGGYARASVTTLSAPLPSNGSVRSEARSTYCDRTPSVEGKTVCGSCYPARVSGESETARRLNRPIGGRMFSPATDAAGGATWLNS